MIHRLFCAAVIGLTIVAPTAAADPPRPVTVVITSSLATAGTNIRQYAFDGDPATAFVSAKNPVDGDTVTVTFDPPVNVNAVSVFTGTLKGENILDAGTLEGSADGSTFDSFSMFVIGTAKASPGKKLTAIRVKVTKDMDHPLAVREFEFDTDPPVAAYKYPVEYTVDTTDDPSLKEWGDKVARLCEKEYPKINEALKSDGFKPRTQVAMTLRADYKGVAAAGNGRITGSVKYFKDRPADVGAMVHETVHIVQSYRGRGNPGWLVEGIADWYRFFLYEPENIGRLNVDRARYDASYRVSARFLDYVTQKYDKEVVKKLNAAMRKGEYKEDLWETYTKKKLPDIGAEWKESLTKK
jgi:hypothetical protein